MVHRLGEDVCYVLSMFSGIGYTVLVICALIWLRMLLPVLEEALQHHRERPHKFVHPLPKNWDLTTSAPPEEPAEVATALPADAPMDHQSARDTAPVPVATTTRGCRRVHKSARRFP